MKIQLVDWIDSSLREFWVGVAPNILRIAMARASETVQVRIRLGKWVYQQLQTEVAGKGRSVADEIAEIVQSLYRQRARSQALENIESTVKAADSTSDAIDKLLNALKPHLPQIDPDYFGKKHRV